jgi:hypothetical protein
MNALSEVKNLTALRVDPSATFAPTQHALAGKAAMALAQMTEKDSHVLAKVPEELLDYVKNVNHIAQKADITRKVLERYLFGTAITRIDPVMVPFTPESVTTYPVPSGDPDVFHPHKLDVPLRNIGNINTGSFKNPIKIASVNDGIVQSVSLLINEDDRVRRIKEFIYYSLSCIFTVIAKKKFRCY